MASENVTMSWANTITWVVVLLGWVVVHIASLSRERRKENREAVEKILEELKLVENLAVEFHTSGKFDSQASDKLIWRVSRLNRALQRPPLKTLDIPLGLMVRFRKCLTLLNTDASTFVPQTSPCEILKNIRNVTDELLEKIEATRDKVFA